MNTPVTGSAPRGPDGRRIRGGPLQALIWATVGFFGGFAGVSLFGPLVPKFTELLHLSPLQAGILAAVPNLSGSLLRIPFGAMVERHGGRRPFLILLALTLLGLPALIAMLAAFYPQRLTLGQYPLLLLLGAVIGCGIATFSVGIAQVAYWFPQRRQGKALAIYAGLGNTAPGLFALLLPVLLKTAGLITAYELWFALLLVVAALYWRWSVDAPSFQVRRLTGRTPSEAQVRSLGQELVPTGDAGRGLALAAANPRTWGLVVLYFLGFGGFLALTAWFPSYWHFYFGTALVTGGLLTLTYSETASLVRVAAGYLSDAVGGETTAVGALLVTGVGALVLSRSTVFALAVAGMVLMAIGMGALNAAVFKLVPTYVPSAVGGAAGWVGGLGAFGGFVIPPLMGAVAGRYGHAGYALGFLVIAGLTLVCLAVALGLRAAAPSRQGAVRSLDATPAGDPPAHGANQVPTL